jgi:imidazolonepropionase-like amidohydrolase
MTGANTSRTLIFCLLALLLGVSNACRAAPNGYLLTHASLIGGNPLRVQTGMTLRLHDGRIRAMAPDGQLAPAQDEQLIDLQGAYVLPGLINAHVHDAYDEAQLRRWVEAGITTVRDLNPHGQHDFLAFRDAHHGKSEFARLLSSSPILTAAGGYGSVELKDSQQAVAVVRQYAKQGVDVIKLAIEDDCEGRPWTLLSADSLSAMTAAAHEAGKRVVAHVTHSYNLQLALDAQIDELAHMVVEPLSDEQLAAVVRRGIYWTPTLELWHGVSSLFPVDYEAQAIDNVRRFHRAGGRVVLGTDFGGFSTPFDRGLPMTEFRLMQQAGMSNGDILLAATQTAAEAIGLDKDLGSLATGKVADLLISTKNPLQDLASLQHPAWVFHNGIVVLRPPQVK